MEMIFEKPIKLIVSEIDGVLTNGMYTEDEIGNVLYKTFNQKDFAAINELKKHYKVAFLCDDNRINYNLCRRKQLPFYWAVGKSKSKILADILRRYVATPDNTIYIGSKISDKKCLQVVPHSMCPDDAGDYLKSIAWAPFITEGGKGIFIELLDLLQYNIKMIKNNG